MPPMVGNVSPAPTAMDMLGAGVPQPPGAGVDQQRAELEAFIGQLRDFSTQGKALFASMPALQKVGQQFDALVQQAVQQVVKSVPPQTGSSEAVPMAGQ